MTAFGIPELGHIEEPYEGAGVGMVESLTETPEQVRSQRLLWHL